MNIISSLKSSILSTTGAYTLPPLVNICRQATLYTLKGIQKGTLSIEDVDGTKHEFGQGDGAQPHSQLKILDDIFWIRLVLGADMVCTVPSLSLSSFVNQTCRINWYYLTCVYNPNADP